MIEDAKMPEPVAYQVLVEGGTEKFCVRADVADEFASRLRKDWGNNVEVRPLYSPDLLDYAQAEQKKRMEAEARVRELMRSVQEVIRISDRKHDAWDAAKAALDKLNGEKS